MGSIRPKLKEFPLTWRLRNQKWSTSFQRSLLSMSSFTTRLAARFATRVSLPRLRSRPTWCTCCRRSAPTHRTTGRLGVKLAKRGHGGTGRANPNSSRRRRHLALPLRGSSPRYSSRRLVDIDYYISLGGSAYGQLARAYERKKTAVAAGLRRARSSLWRLRGGLGRGVADRPSLSTPSGVVQLYERWLKTGSGWAERRLRKSGVVPRRGGDPD